MQKHFSNNRHGEVLDEKCKANQKSHLKCDCECDCIEKILHKNIKLACLQESEIHSVAPDSLQPHGVYSPWNSPGQNTGVDSLSLLQGIFPIQGSNLGLPHWGWIIYKLSHKGSLFNLYAEYIMQNARMDEAQAGIKIAGRNINNLRYADDTTLMAESEEEPKSLFGEKKE